MKRIYILGDKLKCIKECNSKEFDLRNPNLSISVGDIAFVDEVKENNDVTILKLYVLNKHGEFTFIASDYSESSSENLSISDYFEKVEESEP